MAMNASFVLLIAKLLIASTILVFLLVPTKLYPIKEFFLRRNGDDQATFDPSGHFFPIPDSYLSSAVGEETALAALRLPRGTVLSEALTRTAVCMVNADKLGRSRSPCLNRPNVGYAVLICVCCFSVSLGVGQLAFRRRIFEPFRATWALFGATCWLPAVVSAGVFHTIWDDEFWPPKSLHSRRYFEKPTLWTLAVVLSGIYLFICCAEFFGFQSDQGEPSPSLTRHRAIQNDRVDDEVENASDESSIENLSDGKWRFTLVLVITEIRLRKCLRCGRARNGDDDAWSIESPPKFNKRQRYENMSRFRMYKMKTFSNKTWP